MGIEEDSHAFEQIKLFYPNYNIEKLNIVPIIKKGGGLNCITWCRLTNPVLERFLIEYNSFKHEGHLKTTEKNQDFTNEEINFLCKDNLVKFAEIYPGIAEYYMKCLSD